MTEAMEDAALIEQIREVDSVETMNLLLSQLGPSSDKLSADVQEALTAKLVQVTAQSKAEREQIISILKVNGVDYPLTDWLTPANYAKKFGIETNGRQVVNNWISRGIIPADHVKEIPELDLRLVRAVEYAPRPYKVAALEGGAD